MARIKVSARTVPSNALTKSQRAHKALKSTIGSSSSKKAVAPQVDSKQVQEQERKFDFGSDSIVPESPVADPLEPIIVKPLRRKHRWHPGTVARRNHKKLCKDTSMMVSKSAMRRIILGGVVRVSNRIHLAEGVNESIGYMAIDMMDAIIRDTIKISCLFKRKSINPPVLIEKFMSTFPFIDTTPLKRALMRLEFKLKKKHGYSNLKTDPEPKDTSYD
jgi:hypothetical protein